MERPLKPYSGNTCKIPPNSGIGIIMFWLCLIMNMNATEPGNPLQFSQSTRVVAITHPSAVERFSPNEEVVYEMFNRLLLSYSNKNKLSEAWAQYVDGNDIVGIKVLSDPGSVSGTRPVVVEAIVRSLISIGFPKDQIIIWDRRKGVLVATGYDLIAKRHGVTIAGSSEYGYDPEKFYEAPLIGNLVFGDHEFGKDEKGVGRKSFVSKLLSHQLTRIIQVHPMLNHYLGGVNGQIVGLATGGVDNSLRFTLDSDRYHQAIPEICAIPELYDKLALNVVDALICQYQGEERGFLQYSTMLKELRMSRDPVALDVLSIMEINRQRRRAGLEENTSAMQLYQNASLLELGESDVSRIRFEKVEDEGL